MSAANPISQELSNPERETLETAWLEATGEPLSSVLSHDGLLPSYTNLGILETIWLAAKEHYTTHTADSDGMPVDAVLRGLERIVEVANDANKPLHRNEMRVDWAESLGAGERRYVMALRGTLTECARLANETIEQGKKACSCERNPGTDPNCPVHQLAPEADGK